MSFNFFVRFRASNGLYKGDFPTTTLTDIWVSGGTTEFNSTRKLREGFTFEFVVSQVDMTSKFEAMQEENRKLKQTQVANLLSECVLS